jgi:hypothetical protein
MISFTIYIYWGTWKEVPITGMLLRWRVIPALPWIRSWSIKKWQNLVSAGMNWSQACAMWDRRLQLSHSRCLKASHSRCLKASHKSWTIDVKHAGCWSIKLNHTNLVSFSTLFKHGYMFKTFHTHIYRVYANNVHMFPFRSHTLSYAAILKLQKPQTLQLDKCTISQILCLIYLCTILYTDFREQKIHTWSKDPLFYGIRHHRSSKLEAILIQLNPFHVFLRYILKSIL